MAYNGSVTMIDGTRRRFEYDERRDVSTEIVGGEETLTVKTSENRVYYFPMRRIDFIDLPFFDVQE